MSYLSLWIAIPVAVLALPFFLITISFCLFGSKLLYCTPTLCLYVLISILHYYSIPFSEKYAHHRYVQVELDCPNCPSGHYVLYDAITKMKRRRIGLYTTHRLEILNVTSAKRPYDFIEETFEEMPNRLGPPIPGAYDCQDWADELYAKIS